MGIITKLLGGTERRAAPQCTDPALRKRLATMIENGEPLTDRDVVASFSDIVAGSPEWKRQILACGASQHWRRLMISEGVRPTEFYAWSGTDEGREICRAATGTDAAGNTGPAERGSKRRRSDWAF